MLLLIDGAALVVSLASGEVLHERALPVALDSARLVTERFNKDQGVVVASTGIVRAPPGDNVPSGGTVAALQVASGEVIGSRDIPHDDCVYAASTSRPSPLVVQWGRGPECEDPTVLALTNGGRFQPTTVIAAPPGTDGPECEACYRSRVVADDELSVLSMRWGEEGALEAQSDLVTLDAHGSVRWRASETIGGGTALAGELGVVALTDSGATIVGTPTSSWYRLSSADGTPLSAAHVIQYDDADLVVSDGQRIYISSDRLTVRATEDLSLVGSLEPFSGDALFPTAGHLIVYDRDNHRLTALD